MRRHVACGVALLFILVYCGVHCGDIDANKLIHTVYTIARDYRNARLADEETLPKSDKLVNKITDIADLFKAKLHSRIEDKEEWKSIEQQLYTGFMLLLQSCQTKNMKNYLLGSLKVSSALDIVAGIQGSPDINIVEATGYIFQVFGSVLDAKSPSRDQFRTFRTNQTDTDFDEAKFYFENILHPVVVSEGPSGEVEGEGEVESLTKKEEEEHVCCKYTEADVLQILQMNQKPLKVYTKLTGLMMNYCNDNRYHTTVQELIFNKCLTAIKQYSEISTTHQAYLLRALTILKYSKVPDNDLYVHRLIHHVERLFKRDMQALSFLFNPMKYYHATKVIFEVHGKQIEYRELLDHMAVLNTRYNLYSRNGIVLCRQKELKGLCLEIRPTAASNFMGKYWKFQPLKDWTEARSMFIPPRFQVEFESNDLDVARNRPHSYRGPFKGLSVYSRDQPFDLRNIRVSVEPEYQTDPQTRICTETGWCDTFSDDTKSFKSVHGIDISQSLLKSIEIPDGIFVKIFTADGSVIPLVGPFSTEDLDKCKAWSWSNIVQIKKIVVKNNAPGQTDVLYEVFSQREENLGVDDDILKGSEIHVSTKLKRFTESEIAKEERSDMMVVLCTKPYMKGFCVQYSTDYAIRGLFATFQRLFHTECKLGLQSIYVPAGVKLIGFQKVGSKYNAFGPYVGPTILEKLEGNSEYTIEVVNMFKDTKTTSGEVEKPSYRTIKTQSKTGETTERRINSIYDYF